MHYDALLLVSFGGPESNEEVIPFLENVLRGRNVPRERMLAVAEHYYHFGGKSPINAQNRELIAALQAVIITFGGWQSALYFTDEDRDPVRNLPRSMIGGVASVMGSGDSEHQCSGSAWSRITSG